MTEETYVENYNVTADDVDAMVTIKDDPTELNGTYSLHVPIMDKATAVYYDRLKDELLKKITISPQELLDIKLAAALKQKFRKLSRDTLIENIPHLTEDQSTFLSGKMVQEMLGLGDLEFLLKDDELEEICVNSASEPVWVYHKKHGWLKTDIMISSESQIWNYSSSIARRVGRQITIQTPLLDAYLITGDRVNATLAPISANGNTITIRKFARKPWTITDFIESKTISTQVAAFLWLAVQYETSIVISGGTGAGKTSALNVISSFFPSNQRVISIEQTREVTLPTYLQWIPLVVRESTTEGKGAISMLDLLINSLRMRPDRIIVGEIRRAEEATVLFEAIHTGHSVYATMHAETISETIRRLISPPISLPPVMLESLPLIITMFRDRRSGIRRIFEVGEVIPFEGSEDKPPTINMLFKWNSQTDTIQKINEPKRFFKTLKTFTTMSDLDIQQTLKEREEILYWVTRKKINTVEEVGKIFARYYRDKQGVLDMVRKWASE